LAAAQKVHLLVLPFALSTVKVIAAAAAAAAATD